MPIPKYLGVWQSISSVTSEKVIGLKKTCFVKYIDIFSIKNIGRHDKALTGHPTFFVDRTCPTSPTHSSRHCQKMFDNSQVK